MTVPDTTGDYVQVPRGVIKAFGAYAERMSELSRDPRQKADYATIREVLDLILTTQPVAPIAEDEEKDGARFVRRHSGGHNR